MKKFKLFAKISMWLAIAAFVFGGLWATCAWWDVPSDVVLVRTIILCVSVFGISLCAMFILDVAIEAKELDRAMSFRKYDTSDRNARCKGYIDLTTSRLKK